MLAVAAAELTRTPGAIVSMADPHVCAPIDANGNLTSDGARTFEWDALNRLVSASAGTHRAEYSYDAEGRRVGFIEKESSVVQFQNALLMCDAEACEARSSEGSVVRKALSYSEVAASQRYFAGDHLGNVTTVTDSAGSVVARYGYDPWGRRTIASGTDVTDEGFTGHQWHPPSGVLLAPFRGYDPDLGRWLSEDPIRFSGGMNFYGYGAGNPVSNRDPLGLAIHCTASYSEQSFGKCPPGAGACTDANERHAATGCTQQPCGRWSFTGYIYMTYRVTYLKGKTAKGSDGKPYQQHEWQHIDDFQRFCSGTNQNYQSEGFASQGECEAGRRYFLMDVRALFDLAKTATDANLDKKK